MSLLGLDKLAAQRRAERAAKRTASLLDDSVSISPSDSASVVAAELAAPAAKRQRAQPPPVRRTPSPDRAEPSLRKKGWQANEWGGRDEALLWYEGPDEFGGVTGDVAYLEGAVLENALSKSRLEERERQMGKTMQGRVRQYKSLRAEEKSKDADKWEENRMLAAGAMGIGEVEGPADMDEGVMRLHVTRPRPPFLQGNVVFSKRQELVLPVRSNDCELYENAKKGSKLLRFVREKRERERAARDALDASGSHLDVIDRGGQDLRAEEREERRRTRREQRLRSSEENERAVAEEVRKSSQFAPHLQAGADDAEAREAQRLRLKKSREALPIFQSRSELLDYVRENQIIVLIGETGSGKTTQIAQYLFEAGYCRAAGATGGGKLMLGCTQPRRVAAMSVAKRVAEEVGTELGDKVGYAIRFEDCTSEGTLIKYMTDGVLLREAMRDPELSQYSAIIMDEAHERSLNTDVLFGVMKGVAGRRRDLKLIVTSATMDQEKFSAFFCNCPVFIVSGRCYPVETFYKQTNVSDYVDAAVKQAVEVHLKCGPGDILIFMTGQEDIEITADHIKSKLRESAEELEESLLVLPIYSLLPSDLQAKIFEPAPQGKRKCIIATNIAETSLTVDGVFYVIDSGFAKLKIFNPRTGMDALQVFPESQAAARQRMGRAGRTGPGKCYRLFTEYQYHHEMMTMTVPEMQRTNLCNVVLLLKSLGVSNLLHFEFMDAPPQGNLVNSMYQLWMLGALNDAGDLTEQGTDMIEFPVDPAMAKALLCSVSPELRCAEEVLTVVACLSSQANIFLRPRAQEALADQAREKFMVAESDHLTLLNVFQMYRMNGRSMRWCQDNFLNHRALRRVEEVRVQLREIMQQKGKKIESCGLDTDVVKLALVAGYFHNAGKRRGLSDYYSMLTGVPCFVHPSSALYNGGTMPDYVFYHELICTQKEYMSTVSSVDAEWLERVAPQFYRVHDRHRRAPVKPLLPPPPAARASRSTIPQGEAPKGGEHQDSDSREAAWVHLRRGTPGLTPRVLARPGTPGYRRRAGGL
eukprot:Hpha_TRINITY_DN22797_c0_g1::TRINITY_DN22797_c0_g1_i1::g.34310::m.34310/K12815/DHX38, PRP16; pre-mRNA-splicing factor ATP-dependent RNA helicase DHX38/PRP16